MGGDGRRVLPGGGAVAAGGVRPARLGPRALPLLALVIGLLATASPAGPAAAAPADGSGPARQQEWDARGSTALTPDQALAALDTLPADAPAPVSWGEGGGREGWFGPAWQDVDGDGCDTRNEILARDLRETDFSRRPGVQDRAEGVGRGVPSCPDATVYAGVLDDPYTGAAIAFTRGQDTSQAVQIDHVVPLVYLYAHGAWQWSERTRALAANDPLNLLAVDGAANQAKSGCGPATCPAGSTGNGTWDTAGRGGWWPEQDAFRCVYAARFVSVLDAYGLGVPEADRRALEGTLTDCVDGGDGTAGARGVVGRMLSQPAVLGLLVAGSLLVVGGLVVRSRQRAWTRRLLAGRGGPAAGGGS